MRRVTQESPSKACTELIQRTVCIRLSIQCQVCSDSGLQHKCMSTSSVNSTTVISIIQTQSRKFQIRVSKPIYKCIMSEVKQSIKTYKKQTAEFSAKITIVELPNRNLKELKLASIERNFN